jgi:hypothetical protein
MRWSPNPLAKFELSYEQCITELARRYFSWTGPAVWISFIKPDKAMKKAVTETEAYVRDQVGDARSFSLDSPQSREPKLKALRAARSSNGVVMGSALP